MVRSHARVRAVKAPRYFKALCKHFALKVTVEKNEDSARIHFPKGLCRMRVDGETLSFDCRADDQESLEATQWIIDSHVTKFGELRDTEVLWQRDD